MLLKLSRKMTSFFIKKQVIEADQREMYDYCFEVMLSTLLNALAILIVAIATGFYLESLAFAVAFVLMRGCAGGFHADTHLVCFLTLMTIFGAMLVAEAFVPVQILFYIAIVMVALSVVLTLALAPVDNINKPLDADEIKYLRRRVYKVMTFLVPVAIVLLCFKVTWGIAFGLAFAMQIVASMLVCGKIKNYKIKKKNAEMPEIKINFDA